MKGKKDKHSGKVSEWIKIAEEDLHFAKVGLELSSGVSYRIITFHSQQCAEKYLKGLLVFKNIDFPYTHSITTLIDLCSEIDPNFEELRDAELLTSFATASRYPGEFRKLKKQDALKSIKLAEMVRSKVRNVLTASGVNLKRL